MSTHCSMSFLIRLMLFFLDTNSWNILKKQADFFVFICFYILANRIFSDIPSTLLISSPNFPWATRFSKKFCFMEKISDTGRDEVSSCWSLSLRVRSYPIRFILKYLIWFPLRIASLSLGELREWPAVSLSLPCLVSIPQTNSYG